MFLEKFPESKYTASANQKIEELEFQIAKGKNSIQALQGFIEAFPNSEYARKAQKEIVSLAYNEAKGKNTVEGFQNFIDNYPNEKNLIIEAKQTIKDLEFEKADNSGSYDEVLKFFSKGLEKNKCYKVSGIR
jgi:outer membrane protein assembly factor BamD (BamD/ComL family)